jgi:uncharacterized protein (TIGR02147 family)
MTVQQDYRSILKTALVTKDQNRENLSLRALAKKLDMSTSFLSEVLNGKKSLSVDLAFKIAIKLDFTNLEAQSFCLLVQLDQEKDPAYREKLLERLNDLNPQRKTYDLSADLFKTIAEWHHAAILELTYLRGFKPTPENIAAYLGIPKTDAELAVERLERLELIERDAHGRLKKAHNYLTSEAKIPLAAFKQFHGQVLNKALAALHTHAPSERVSATDVMAFDSKHIDRVERLSREFSSAVLKLAQRSKVKDSVFALSTQFFPLTQKDGKT